MSERPTFVDIHHYDVNYAYKNQERILIEEILVSKTISDPIFDILQEVCIKADKSREVPPTYFAHPKTAIDHYHIVLKLVGGDLVIPKPFASEEQIKPLLPLIADLFRIDNDKLFILSHWLLENGFIKASKEEEEKWQT